MEILGGDETVDQSEAHWEELRQASEETEIPGYHLQDTLGAGAFGEVWLAIQERTGQQVALKLMRRGGGPGFDHELHKLKTLAEHPYVLTILDADLNADPPYLVTPFLKGGALDRLKHPPALKQATVWIEQIAQALCFTHDKFILHCDLKPSNILLDEEERVRLADFGQAVHSDQKEVRWGTLGYMAPEQADLGSEKQGSTPNPRWDIYSFGATAYQLLTGRRPRLTREDEETLSDTPTIAIRLELYRDFLQNRPLVPVRQLNPSVDSELAALVECCLHLDPARRPSSMTEVLEDLERRKARLPLLCRRPWSLSYRASRAIQRPGWQLAAVLLTATVILVGQTLLSRHRLQTMNEQLRHRLLQSQIQRGQTAAQAADLASATLFRASALTYGPEQAGLRFQLSHLRYRLQTALSVADVQCLDINRRGNLLLVGTPLEASLWERTEQTVSERGRWSRLALRLRFPELGGIYSTVTRVYWSRDDARMVVAFCAGGPLSLFGGDFRSEILSCLPDESYEDLSADENLRVLLARGPDRAVALIDGKPVSSRDCTSIVGALNRDGSLAATVKETEMELWSPATGRVVSRFDSGGEITALAFSPDGKMIATAVGYNPVKAEESEVQSLTPPTSGVVRIRTMQGKEVCPPIAVGSSLDTLIFSRDSRRLAVGSDSSVQVWPVNGGAALTPALSLPGSYRDLSFGDKGRRLYVATGSRVQVWEVPGGRLLATLPVEGPAAAVAVSSDDSWLAVGSEGGVRVWRTDDGWDLRITQPGVVKLRLSPDEKEVVAVGAGRVMRWRLADGEQVSNQPFDNQTQRLTPDGQIVSRASAGEKTAGEQSRFDPTGRYRIVYSKDRLVLWDEDRKVRELAAQALPFSSAQLTLRSTFNPGGELFALYTARKLHTFYSASGEAASPAIEGGELAAVSLSPDQKSLALVRSSNGRSMLEMLELATGRVRWSAPVGKPMVSRFSPDGKLVAAAFDEGENSMVRVWNTAAGAPVTGTLDMGEGFVVSLQFHPTKNWLIASTRSLTYPPGPGRLEVWDLDTRQSLLGFTGLQWPTPVVFADRGESMVFALGDEIHIVDLSVDTQIDVETLQAETRKSMGAELDSDGGLRLTTGSGFH